MKEKLKCPHCTNTGQMYVCTACNTVFCNNCKKTIQGQLVVIKNATYECPVCKTIRKTELAYK